MHEAEKRSADELATLILGALGDRRADEHDRAVDIDEGDDVGGMLKQ
jgi:hypothetical protein